MASRTTLGAFGLCLLGAAASCSGGGEDSGSGNGAQSARGPSHIGTSDRDLANALAVLEVFPLDVWGRPLETSELAVAAGTASIKPESRAGLLLSLEAAGDYKIHLGSTDHQDANVVFKFDGSKTLTADFAALGAERPGVSISSEVRTIAGKQKTVLSIYVGLRHKWFSAQGRPARKGNDIELFMTGQDAWSHVHADLKAAKKNVNVSTWWWESDFELVRDAATHADLTAEQRTANTIIGTLESTPAIKRVLVGQFWGQDSIIGWMSSDKKLRAHAERNDDAFEFMGMGNPTRGKFHFKGEAFSFRERVRAGVSVAADRKFVTEPDVSSIMPERDVDLTQYPISVDLEAASYHQKFMTIDDELAYVGGMNLRRVDWDTSKHEIFEPRRMLFGASRTQRQEVSDRTRMPDMGPRKDYMVRLVGPSSQDVADVFHKRWAYQRDQAVDYSQNTSDFEVFRAQAARAGGKQVQVTATLPQPFWEHSIGETWISAVRQAEKYIYIEDQYFRMPLVNTEIKARMDAKPDLKLIVITMPVDEIKDPGCAQTARAYTLFHDAFPNRFLYLHMVAFDWTSDAKTDKAKGIFQQIDTHSKMLIVDDRFMSIGSANKNNRGITYEGEMNLAILDDAWVSEQRARAIAALLPQGAKAYSDTKQWFEQLKNYSQNNDVVWDRWKQEKMDVRLSSGAPSAEMIPQGRIYTLVQRPLSQCLLESVGPDMTGRSDDAAGE